MQETTKTEKTIAVFVTLLIIGLAVTAYMQNSSKSDIKEVMITEDATTTNPIINPITNPTNNMITTSTGLQYEEVVLGTGEEAKAGMMVSVNYKGTFKDGSEFDNSYKRGAPIEFTLGAQQVIAGWDEGIAGMKVGGKRKLIIPAELGYGPNDYGPIPGGSVLFFDVELVGVK